MKIYFRYIFTRSVLSKGSKYCWSVISNGPKYSTGLISKGAKYSTSVISDGPKVVKIKIFFFNSDTC